MCLESQRSDIREKQPFGNLPLPAGFSSRSPVRAPSCVLLPHGLSVEVQVQARQLHGKGQRGLGKPGAGGFKVKLGDAARCLGCCRQQSFLHADQQCPWGFVWGQPLSRGCDRRWGRAQEGQEPRGRRGPPGPPAPCAQLREGRQERERRQRARCLPQAAGTLVSWVRACCWGLVEGEEGNARREDEIMHPSLAQIGVVRLGDARSSLPDSALLWMLHSAGSPPVQYEAASGKRLRKEQGGKTELHGTIHSSPNRRYSLHPLHEQHSGGRGFGTVWGQQEAAVCDASRGCGSQWHQGLLNAMRPGKLALLFLA